ncbi:glycosyltransferase family 2 protein [Grimontia hollisae]|uniref:Glycosyltransferases-like protein n=1 Tax=Grimontia hollisae CIP 101886 TaxID=675812 RepID=D0IAR1_GRIHO|nr:galactosyltransferase-related protein [Grimontia hollisae]EEY70979.1 glycosyltransferases-like protein [Grimontia hollisae CIP 101886]STO44419.1 dTDP-Rha:alpha-D-GlcNAc-pyrophosphate polyprenol, alpha-3-L-rhamnosyltransferase [Grimontia hollisae]
MRFVVSVVSHEHEEMIINFGTLRMLSSLNNVIVICRDNIPSSLLKNHCDDLGVHYIANHKERGFAENNNLNFLYYMEKIKRKKNDIFLLVNPDIILSRQAFKIFSNKRELFFNNVVTVNLFLDESFTRQDHNVRRYPTFYDFLSSYLLNKNKTIIFREGNSLPKDGVFWTSGAFLAVSVKNFLKMNGLDETYYMYCEDVDFCRRASLRGIKVKMILNSRVVHTRSRDSRKFLSKYFFWHVSGVVKYVFFRGESCQPKRSSLMVLKERLLER